MASIVMNDKVKHVIAGAVIAAVVSAIAYGMMKFDILTVVVGKLQYEGWGFLAAIIAGFGKETFDFVKSMKTGMTFKQAFNAKAFDSFYMMATAFGGFIVTAVIVLFF